MKRRIIVLANSVKHGSHCVAGKDIRDGGWVRPVSSAGGAELPSARCVCINTKPQRLVRPLDIVDINVGALAPLINQPENCICSRTPWILSGNMVIEDLGKYLDQPETLWGPGDRVSYSAIEAGEITIRNSLYLVQVESLKLYKNGNKRRARFRYNTVAYDLSVTDPNFDSQLDSPSHSNTLCVSLGEKFNPWGGDTSYCFKIVATVI